MLYTRYHLARSFAQGKDVLEIACGAGLGLGYLAQVARRVVGGDCTEALLNKAQAHYSGRIPLLCLDAGNLPLRDSCFDVIVLFEAIYYLSDPEAFLLEAHRLLRGDGVLLICSANRRWPGFNPSPFSHRYFSLEEMAALLRASRFDPQMFGGFPEQASGPIRKMTSLIRSVAVRAHLIPKTMRGKAVLKRIFYGRLEPLAEEVQDRMAEVGRMDALSPRCDDRAYKVLYAVARRA